MTDGITVLSPDELARAELLLFIPKKAPKRLRDTEQTFEEHARADMAYFAEVTRNAIRRQMRILGMDAQMTRSAPDN